MPTKTTTKTCPHCDQRTSTRIVLCTNCGGFVDMTAVLLTDAWCVSVADGSMLNTEGPVLLLTASVVPADGSQRKPVTLAIPANDVSGVRNLLLDGLMTVGVHIANGRHRHDEARSSHDS